MLYVDGMLDGSKPSTGLIAQNHYPMEMGQNAEAPRIFFDGEIDEVSLYHRALSAAEIQAIYTAGHGGKCPPSPPVILSQPTNQTVVVGGTAVFEVLAVGTLPLSYQWTFNNTNLFGAANVSLTLTNVQLNQAGDYAVRVTNLYGAVISSNAVLVVNPALHFVWNPISSPRFVGAPFNVVVQAQNPTNGLAGDFTNTVALLTTNSVTVSPSVSGSFVQGVWTGAVTIARTGTNLVLEAADGNGNIGLANPINVVNLPNLATAAAGGTFYLFWPASSSGFALETSPDLSPGSWMPVAEPPVRIGDQYVESIAISGTNQFFRLRFTGQ